MESNKIDQKDIFSYENGYKIREMLADESLDADKKEALGKLYETYRYLAANLDRSNA